MHCVSIILSSLFVLTASYHEKLPGNVVPNHYNLIILTDLDEFTFHGEVIINIICKKVTDVIKLHAVKKALEIREIDVSLKRRGKSATPELVKWTDFDLENDLFIIKTNQNLSVGKVYRLRIPFRGKLKDEMKGYYKTMYFDEISHTYKYLTMTNFHYRNARKAFPCFDEPSIKAVFSIRLGHKSTLFSLSNMPHKKIGTTPGQDLVWDDFADTPPIATHQVAFVVSELESLESVTPNQPTLRFYGRSEILSKFEMVRATVPTLLKSCEEYLGSFMLPKIDFLAVPSNNYHSNENWGVISAGEQYILDRMDGPLSTETVYMLSRELTHQWLGNLVSTRSWETFWLFKSIAEYSIYIHGHKVFDNWDALNYRLATTLNELLYSDAEEYSNFIVNDPKYEVDVEREDTWKKGTMLLRMLHLTLGDKVFKEGLQKFVNKYKFTSVGVDELWDVFNSGVIHARGNILSGLTNAWHKSSKNSDGIQLPKGLTVKEFMNMWTNRPGYPVITVTRLNNGLVQVTQKRFLRVRPKLGDPQGCWWIPLTFATATKPIFSVTQPKQWLGCDHRKSGIIFDTTAGRDEWIIFNNNFAGLYRIKYDSRNWALITSALNAPEFSKIPVLNRVQLVSDALQLAWSGDLSYHVVFRLLDYLRQETVHLQWQAVFRNLKDLNNVLYFTPLQDDYAKVMKPIVTPIFEKIFSNIWTYNQAMPLDENEKNTEIAILELACKWGVESCVNQVKSVYASWKASGADPKTLSDLPEGMKFSILCNSIKYGDDEDFFYLVKLLSDKNGMDRRQFYLSVLGCSTNLELLKKLLNWSVTINPVVSDKESISVFMSVASSHHGFEPALKFFYENFSIIFNFFHGEPRIITDLIYKLGSQMTSLNQLTELRNFVSLTSHLAGMVEAKSALEQVSQAAMPNIIWLSEHYKAVSEAIHETLMINEEVEVLSKDDEKQTT